MATSRAYKAPSSGFTLVEVLTTLVILALLIGFAIPSYQSFMNQKRLRMATEDLYNFIKASQSRGLNLPSSYYMSIKTGPNWCYAISDSAICDCSTANSCTIAGVETLIRSTDYTGESLSLSTTGFNGTAAAPYILFEGKRGTIGATGSITLTSVSGLSTTINANQQGLVAVCSDNLTSYPPC